MKDTIITDLDGTLCDISHRVHHVRNGNNDWDKFFEECIHDTPKWPTIQIVNLFYEKGYRILICSGRSDQVFDKTMAWLHGHGVKFTDILMRPAGNTISDVELKKGWYEAGHFKKKEVLFVMDDRDRLVEMWRDEGFTCHQVAPGDF